MGNGDNAFKVGMTPGLQEGRKRVAVRVQNLEERSRWYSGAGLYRPVHLVLTQPVAVATWGTTITTPKVSKESALVEVKTALRQPAKGNITITYDILTVDSLPIGISQEVTPFSDGTSVACMEVQSPRLWSPETHELYLLRTNVRKDGKLTAQTYTRFGIRSIAVTAENECQFNVEDWKV